MSRKKERRRVQTAGTGETQGEGERHRIQDADPIFSRGFVPDDGLTSGQAAQK